MTNVVIVVENGMITDVLCRNKNVSIEVIDLDEQDPDLNKEMDERYQQLLKSKSYKRIY